jgi:hypothetical protein
MSTQPETIAMSTQIYESHAHDDNQQESIIQYLTNRDFLRKAAEYQLLVQGRREKRVTGEVTKMKKK